MDINSANMAEHSNRDLCLWMDYASAMLAEHGNKTSLPSDELYLRKYGGAPEPDIFVFGWTILPQCLRSTVTKHLCLRMDINSANNGGAPEPDISIFGWTILPQFLRRTVIKHLCLRMDINSANNGGAPEQDNDYNR